MPNAFSGFFAALSFLTRLAPTARVEESSLAVAMRFMPLVGLVLGLLTVGPMWLGILDEHPTVQAWLCALLLVWLTRGLHHDGLSDVCDGMAAHFDRERFWEIMKDSRVGAFGVLGLVLGVAGQIVLLQALFADGLYGAALFAPVMGRFCAVALGHANRTRTRPGLGRLFIEGATRPALLFALGCTLVIGLVLLSPAHGPGRTLVMLLGAFIGAAHFQFPLFSLSRRVGALNGDFLGCSILTGELGAMIGMLVAA